MKIYRKVKNFCVEAATVAYRKVKGFVFGLFRNVEATAILILGSFGLNMVLGEIPFYVAAPLWVEAAYVIPVVSVIGILLLLRSAEWRSGRRMSYGV